MSVYSVAAGRTSKEKACDCGAARNKNVDDEVSLKIAFLLLYNYSNYYYKPW